jgi:hypothetical protein
VSSYAFALVVHLFALIAAFGAAAVLHVAMIEVRTAQTAGDALRRLAVAHKASRVFPVAMLALVASGAWMVHRSWSWTSGFVVAGLAGVVFLGLCGDAVAGRRAAGVARSLAARPDGPVSAVVTDRSWWCASFASSGIALAVVVDMVTKPSLAIAVVVLVGGGVLGAAAGEAARGDRTRDERAAAAAG